MVAAFPSSQNVFVKDHAATGNMVVDFSRNEDWALNKYVQVVPVTKPAGYYLKMTIEEAARIINTDLAEFAWADNADAPQDNDGTESFEFKEFLTRRYKYGFRIGQRTEQVASWDITSQHSRLKGQQAMTARTLLAVTALTTAANYDSSHTSAVTSISGVSYNWAQSTTASGSIKRSLNYAAEKILLDTNGAVDPSDLVLVMSPGCAKEISQSQEVVDYLKGSSDALAYLQGRLPSVKGTGPGFGMPVNLFGFNVVIEKTVRVSTRKGATTTRGYVLPDAKPFLCARPGALEGMYGSPSFSTCTVFVLEDMTVETKEDSDNRLVRGRVVDDIGVVMTAPVSGFLFTEAV